MLTPAKFQVLRGFKLKVEIVKHKKCFYVTKLDLFILICTKVKFCGHERRTTSITISNKLWWVPSKYNKILSLIGGFIPCRLKRYRLWMWVKVNSSCINHDRSRTGGQLNRNDENILQKLRDGIKRNILKDNVDICMPVIPIC